MSLRLRRSCMLIKLAAVADVKESDLSGVGEGVGEGAGDAVIALRGETTREGGVSKFSPLPLPLGELRSRADDNTGRDNVTVGCLSMVVVDVDAVALPSVSVLPSPSTFSLPGGVKSNASDDEAVFSGFPVCSLLSGFSGTETTETCDCCEC